jgi:uroporphyrin-3 C-methyltransferase
VSEVDSDKAAQQPKGNDPVAPQKPVKKEPPKDSKEPPKTPPPETSPAAASDSRGGGKALAGFALLVGLAGLAAGGYSVWQTQQLAEQERQQVDAAQATREQARQLDQRSQQLASRLTRLEQLPSAEQLEDRRRLLSELQSDQQRLSGRVEQVLGASREQWRLAEAEHLLRMAMLRLSAMQDVNSAESLIAEADLILRKQDDPGAYGARQKLLEGLEALRSLPELDRTGLFLQLGALRGQVNQLSGLAPEFENGPSQSATQGESRWRQWLDELTRYVRIDFNAGTDVKPLLAGQSLAQVRLALSLAIEQAQWAVLNGNEEVYRQSLDQAARLIEDHFSEENGQSRGLRDRIEQLAKRQVSVTLPDLAPALQALQAYVQKRESAGDSEPAGGAERGEPAGEAAQPAEADQTAEGDLRT